MSFRRCRDGLCGVYGQHWGGPERDRFGRVAHRLEEMGVAALLVNCIPPDHVAGMVSWLRDFTDLPLGVYPDLGYLTEDGWQFATDVGGDEYAALAGQWREEGAQIVGGCCGVGPEHIAADAVSNAKTNAFRNGVPDRVATEVVDLYPWVPHERWEVMVASLFQMPVDRILGGCCSAGPEHIRALASRLATTETHATARLDH